MIVTPTEDVNRALSMLENNGHFKVVRSWLHDSLHATDEHLRIAKGEAIGQAQGSAQTLADIIKHLTDARVRVQKKDI